MPVTSVTEDQQADQTGNLIDVYIVTFTISSRPGSFTVTVPKGTGAIAEAEAAISAEAAQVTGIYGIST